MIHMVLSIAVMWHEVDEITPEFFFFFLFRKKKAWLSLQIKKKKKKKKKVFAWLIAGTWWGIRNWIVVHGTKWLMENNMRKTIQLISIN